MSDILSSSLFIGVLVAIGVELFVVSGAWARLAEWWRKQTTLYVDDDDAPVISSLYEFKKDRR